MGVRAKLEYPKIFRDPMMWAKAERLKRVMLMLITEFKDAFEHLESLREEKEHPLFTWWEISSKQALELSQDLSQPCLDQFQATLINPLCERFCLSDRTWCDQSRHWSPMTWLTICHLIIFYFYDLEGLIDTWIDLICSRLISELAKSIQLLAGADFC